MITDENLPDGWTSATERTETDDVMQREFESKRYEHEKRGETVFINEVQEPKDLEGWGYQVVVEDPAGDAAEKQLDVVEALDEARDVALEYMARHGGE